MNSRRIRWLLWAGCLGYIILFAGDMLYYGARGAMVRRPGFDLSE